MAGERIDYTAAAVEAARSVLIELSVKFATLDHIGPRDVAEFDESLDAEERSIRQRDAFERVQYLLKRLEPGG